MRQPSAEGVLALSPSLILALEEAGPKEAIEVLEHANVSFAGVPDKLTPDGIVGKVETIARDVRAD